MELNYILNVPTLTNQIPAYNISKNALNDFGSGFMFSKGQHNDHGMSINLYSTCSVK
jgi:hypothetical protein